MLRVLVTPTRTVALEHHERDLSRIKAPGNQDQVSKNEGLKAVRHARTREVPDTPLGNRKDNVADSELRCGARARLPMGTFINLHDPSVRFRFEQDECMSTRIHLPPPADRPR